MPNFLLYSALRAHRLHEAAHRDNVHRVHDAVPYAGPAEVVIVSVPVPELLLIGLVGAVVIDRAERLSAGIERRRKGREYLKGGTRLTVGIGRTV